MIPLIGSLCYGPLGVRQLPRTWWKTLLRKAGLLDDEYPDCSIELDTWLLAKLGLDKDAALAYLRDEMPTYLDFEAWVLNQKGGALDQTAVHEWNALILSRVHKPGPLARIHDTLGLENDGTIISAVILNHLEDWHFFHQRDLHTDFSALGGQVVPLIGSLDFGALKVCQLPRTWLKVLLRAVGLLHPDYPDVSGGLDAGVLNALSLDPDATLAFLREERPTYLEFETWVLDHKDGSIDRGAAEEWNRYVRGRVHNERKRAEIHATLGLEDNGALTSAVVLNHIEDWHLAHADLVGD